ncbi:ABC transporter permease [Pelomonas sp. SE-A7]|uniref:ABC transporter permease n=1 Tax=Pelomonas sp. SE-A7 TaxID=3054953 RepID=UPI00259C68EB|nr:ABC transporter permease [Pelomonas sp. SE-A7]MDM4768180.1 ABC transporter permease [Pelomonas sp. SE-A7]
MSLALLRRTLWLLATLGAASLLIFALLDLLPGNAAQVLLGPDAAPEAVQALSRQLGLDRSAPERYLAWIAGLLRGELGDSASYGAPAWPLIVERLQLTLPLALLAFSFALVIALSAGVYAASRHGRFGDFGVMALSQLGIAVPGFWLAILLMLLFSVKLQWLPAGGFPGWRAEQGGGLWPALQALLLPAIALGLVQGAILARVTRSSLVELLREDFVRNARAQGLSRRALLWGPVLRNALLPVLTLAGLQFANLLAGAIVVENVFTLPGLGRLIFQAIANRDLILVRNAVMLAVALVLAINFVVDLLYLGLDPRLRRGGPR